MRKKRREEKETEKEGEFIRSTKESRLRNLQGVGYTYARAKL
jgi:hypothetical protein